MFQKFNITPINELGRKTDDADKKIPCTSVLVKDMGYNAKITKIESKITSINGLSTAAALNTVKNKISLVI